MTSQKQLEIPLGATCFYERDEKGQWWVVWGADFPQDKPGRALCPNSFEMECAYEQGFKDGQTKVL